MATSLGKLRQIDLLEFWDGEAGGLSAWLAQKEILQMLGEAIGIGLEPVSGEMPMALLKGGVLAKQTKNEAYVIIQGQLEATTHDDLGKLVTYAAGLNALAVVWVASKIPEEHRKALDWLNEVSRDEVSFYGTELELWRIDDSAPAPKFSLVSQPNFWARHLKLGQEDHIEQDEQFVQEESSVIEAKSPAPVKKGEWDSESTTKVKEKPAPSPHSTKSPSPSKEKDGVSVRQNFVYTKTYK